MSLTPPPSVIDRNEHPASHYQRVILESGDPDLFALHKSPRGLLQVSFLFPFRRLSSFFVLASAHSFSSLSSTLSATFKCASTNPTLRCHGQRLTMFLRLDLSSNNMIRTWCCLGCVACSYPLTLLLKLTTSSLHSSTCFTQTDWSCVISSRTM